MPTKNSKAKVSSVKLLLIGIDKNIIEEQYLYYH